jgi:hypothetical protein
MLHRMIDRILCRPSGAYEFVLCRSIEPEAHPPLAENIKLLSELLSIRQIINYVV